MIKDERDIWLLKKENEDAYFLIMVTRQRKPTEAFVNALL